MLKQKGDKSKKLEYNLNNHKKLRKSPWKAEE